MSFPSNPSNNDIYNFGNKTYRWDGQSWTKISAVLVAPSYLGNVAGDIVPLSDNAFDLGTVTKKWENIYLSNSISANVWSGLYTANVIESSSLYFTNARVYSNISPLLNTNTITEGSNLYFTNVRVGNYLSGSLQTNIIPSANSTFTLGNVNNRFNELYLSGNTSFTASNSFISNPTLQGTTYSQQFVEVLNTKTFATGNVTHDFGTGAIFYHSNINTNFTANFTNVPVIENRTISLALVLNQHATSYIANAIQIDGANQTIKWVNGIVPSGSASNVNVQNFTLVRANTSWLVLGSLSAFI